MKKMMMLMAGVCAIALLAGCSTDLSREAYAIRISAPKEGSEFKIYNRNGEYIHHGATPAVIVLPGQSYYFTPESYTFEFGNGQKLHFDASISPWYFGNIITPWGFITDGFTGSMWMLPKKVVLGEPSPEWEINLL